MRLTRATDFHLGDRVLVTNTEFPDWAPTKATVVKLYLKFPNAAPDIRREMIEVRLDKHPFPEKLWDDLRNFAFDVTDPNIKLESIK